MKTPVSRIPLIVGIGWVATAAIAFSIGRIGSPSPSGVGVEADAGASANRLRRAQRDGGDGSGPAAGMNGQFAMGEDGGPLTLARVTNGQPIDKWMKKLMSQEDDIVRMAGLLRFLEAVKSPADLKAALEEINLRGDRGFGRSSHFTEYAMILEKWTQLDPNGAIAFAESRSREEKMLGTSTVLRTWTRTDASAAIAWAQANGKESSPDNGSRGAPPGWGGQGISALSTVLTQLATTDLDRALSVAATETFDRRSRTLDTFASELVRQRGFDGAKGVIDAMAPGSLKDGLITQLADKFASADAPAAAEWAASLPAGDAKSRALAESVGEWAKKDAVAAGTFLASLPATAEADRSRESYANTIVQKNPESALAWASAITDEDRRLRTVENVARSWVRQDATAAKAWLAQSTLPEEVKTRLQAPGRGRGSSR
jgi:hypothetical protein